MRFLKAIIVLVLFSQIVLAASTSTNYKLASDVVSLGTANLTSASYNVRSVIRQRQITIASSTSFSIGEGFLRTAYFGGVIFAPIVTAITPGSGTNNTTVDITNLAGANFQDGAAIKLSKSGQTDITATKVVVVNSGKITCTFDLTDAAVGLWTVTVVGSDGRSGSLPSAFTIGYPAPDVKAVAPEKGVNNENNAAVIISGEYFRSGASVKLALAGENDIVATQALTTSSTKITARFNLLNKTAGSWNVVVTNDDEQSDTLVQGFKISAPVLASPGIVEVTHLAEAPTNSVLKPMAIKYNITDDADVIINIYNMRGEKVWVYNASAGSEGGKVGTNEIVWDGITAFNSFASEGVYILHVMAKVDGQWKLINKLKFAVVK